MNGQQGRPTHDPASPGGEQAVAGAVRKASLRVLPLLAMLSLVCFLDRANSGYAALRMNADIGLSATAFGLGAGLFFVGYFLCEIPSNIVLHKVGARTWLARIAFTWGLLASASAFVGSPAAFYFMRFLLGVAEAGFYPGVVVYLSYWFPRRCRARALSLLLLAVPVSSVLGALVSTWLMEHGRGVLGFDAGWRAMVFLEGLPALVLAVACWVLLPDRPREARWLTPQEQHALTHAIDAEDRTCVPSPPGLRASLLDRRVVALCLVYFCIVYGTYALALFLPQIVAGMQRGGSLHFTLVEIGLVSAVPYGLSTVAMVWNARHSDRTHERVLHIAVPAVVGATGAGAALYFRSPYLSIAALSLCAIGCQAVIPVFWQLPSAFLRGVGAAGGIALINSVGNLSGFAAPYLTGWLYDRTGNYRAAMWSVAVCLALAAFLVLALQRPLRATAPDGGAV